MQPHTRLYAIGQATNGITPCTATRCWHGRAKGSKGGKQSLGLEFKTNAAEFRNDLEKAAKAIEADVEQIVRLTAAKIEEKGGAAHPSRYRGVPAQAGI